MLVVIFYARFMQLFCELIWILFWNVVILLDLYLSFENAIGVVLGTLKLVWGLIYTYCATMKICSVEERVFCLIYEDREWMMPLKLLVIITDPVSQQRCLDHFFHLLKFCELAIFLHSWYTVFAQRILTHSYHSTDKQFKIQDKNDIPAILNTSSLHQKISKFMRPTIQ